MTRRILAAAAVGVAAAGLCAPTAAWAHGLVGKQDLPVPQWLFAWAAALALVASFVGLAVLWPRPRLQDLSGRAVLAMPRAVEAICGAVGVAVFVGAVYVGFAGVQNNPQANIVPTFVFVAFWVGVPFASALFGDVFAAFNPWRAIGRATGWVVGRFGSAPAPLTYPARLGRRPAALGLLAFAWVELVYPDKDDPSQLAIMMLAYAAVQLVGMSLYGERAWSRNADAFGVWFSVLGRLSPLQWTDGKLRLRPPLSGVVWLAARPGTVALICVGIGTTSFDGFSQGTLWNSAASDAVPWLTDRGLNVRHATELFFSFGLLVAVLVIAALYRLGIQGVHGVDRRRGVRELGGLFAHTLVPIAMAYLVAHYFSLLMFQGQAMGFLISDPLGHGADLFGTADATINYTFLSSNVIWYVQVAALVAGHVAALILAHDRAIAMYDNSRDAARSQYWMLGVMVSFTCLALYLLSAAAQ